MPTIDTPLGRIMIRATDIVSEISNQDWQWWARARRIIANFMTGNAQRLPERPRARSRCHRRGEGGVELDGEDKRQTAIR